MNSIDLERTVPAAKNGDKAAIEKLYIEYRGRIWFFVSKNVYSAAAVEDIVSDTFLTAFEKLNELKCSRAFASWLYSIAYNKCLQHNNSESGIARFDSEEELESTIENNSLNEPVRLPSDYLENAETTEQLKAAINSLKPDMRSAVMLYYFEELSVADVGKALGLNENAAKQKLFQARKKLTAKLKKLCRGGSVFCLVPIGAVVNAASGVSAAAGAGRAAFKTGLAARFIGGCTAAAIAAGVPAALSRAADTNKDLPEIVENIGDSRPEEQQSVEEETVQAVPVRNDDLISEAGAAVARLKDKGFEYTVDYQPVNSEEHIIRSGEAYDIDLPEYLLGYMEDWSVSSADDAAETARCCETLYFPAADTEVKLYCLSENNEPIYRLYIPARDSRQLCIEFRADKDDEYIEDKVFRSSKKSFRDDISAENA